MRIGLIAPGGFDRSGRKAVIRALLNLTERLARRHQVTVVVLNQEPGTLPLSASGCRSNQSRAGAERMARPHFLPPRTSYDDRKLEAVGRRLDVLHAFWI